MRRYAKRASTTGFPLSFRVRSESIGCNPSLDKLLIFQARVRRLRHRSCPVGSSGNCLQGRKLGSFQNSILLGRARAALDRSFAALQRLQFPQQGIRCCCFAFGDGRQERLHQHGTLRANRVQFGVQTGCPISRKKSMSRFSPEAINFSMRTTPDIRSTNQAPSAVECSPSSERTRTRPCQGPRTAWVRTRTCPGWRISKQRLVNPDQDMGMLHAIRDAVLQHKADVGLGFDGDGDRCGVVAAVAIRSAEIAAAAVDGRSLPKQKIEQQDHSHHCGEHLTAQVPSSSSCMVSAAIPPLFDRRADLIECAVEVGADPVDGGDDHNADAHRDQGVFDCRRARLIAQKARQ